MSELKLFDQLPKDYKDTVNHIVEQCLVDELPAMNDAFREWQAEIYLAGALNKDKSIDRKTLEIEALAFRAGWEMREQILGVLS